jgi:hypothetical protein
MLRQLLGDLDNEPALVGVRVSLTLNLGLIEAQLGSPFGWFAGKCLMIDSAAFRALVVLMSVTSSIAKTTICAPSSTTAV